MIAYASILLVLVVGVSIVGIANRLIYGKFQVRSGWYLLLGLTLLLPFVDSPFLLARSLAHPNPNINEFLWLRTGFFCLGAYLTARYVWSFLMRNNPHKAMNT
jgi:hypothetical protein